MSNPRKVQTEIEKLLKKVKDGIDVYDGVFDKVQTAPDRLQKEKFEADLKKEIKKLQRLREQIKNLLVSPEVKDKKQLETTRRDIEIKMEAFKVCERETKTKAFSKEGLATAKTDPAQLAKMKTATWVNDAIDKLETQIDQLEYDIESDPNPPVRKSKKAGSGDSREERIARNKYHILKLESLLRVLENGDIEPEDVDPIEEDVMAYVESVTNPQYEEDEAHDIYEAFDLPEGMVQNIGGASDSDDDESTASPKKKDPAPAAAAPEVVLKTPPQKVVPKPAAKKAPDVPQPTSVKTTPGATAQKQPVTVPAALSKPSSSPLTPAAAAQVMPRTASQTLASAGKSMAAVVAGHRATPAEADPGPARPKPVTASTDGLDDAADENNDDTFGDEAMDGVTPGGSLAELATMTTTKMTAGDWAKPLPAAVGAASKSTGATVPGQGTPTFLTRDMPVPQPPGSSAGSPRTSSSGPAWGNAQPPPAVTAAVQSSQVPVSTQPISQAPVPVHASTGQAPVPTHSSVNSGTANNTSAPSAGGSWPTSAVQRMLSMSLRNLPHFSDCERLKPYSPPNPHDTPEYYPQQVLQALNSPETFAKFEPDTLFFIFYYQQTTYQQYLAAKKLKRDSWRFHMKHHRWYRRREPPTSSNDKFERGSYIYFDFEKEWSQLTEENFVFEYAELEDECR